MTGSDEENSSGVDRVINALDVGLQSAGPIQGERLSSQCWRCEQPAVNDVGLCASCRDSLVDSATTADDPEDEYELTMVDVFVPGVFMSQITGGENPLNPSNEEPTEAEGDQA